MIELPQGITAEDLQQWLQGGICMARQMGVQNGAWRPATVDNVLGATTVSVRFLDEDWRQQHEVATPDLRVHWPLCGSVNTSHGCAVHIERIPQKQYKRTLNTRQLRYEVPKGWEIGKALGQAVVRDLKSPSIPVLRGLFNPDYPRDYDEALGRLANGAVSVAINPRMIVAGDDIGKRTIYYRGDLAATIIGNEAQAVTDELTVALINKVTGGRYTWR